MYTIESDEHITINNHIYDIVLPITSHIRIEMIVKKIKIKYYLMNRANLHNTCTQVCQVYLSYACSKERSK